MADVPTSPPSHERLRIGNWGRHMQARQVHVSACRALGHDVRVMPLKGVMLVAMGLVDAAERPISDVDLLVLDLDLGQAAARLAKHGFVIVDVPIAQGYLSLVPPGQEDLSIDVHTRLVPRGLGSLSPAYMFEGACSRHDLFEVPVYVPTVGKLAVHTLANIIKDRIVHALPHTAADLASVLRALSDAELEMLALALRQLSLVRGATLALTWAAEQKPDERCARLLGFLLSEWRGPRAPEAELARLRRDDRGGIWARLAARTAADSVLLRATASMAAGRDVLTWPLRRAVLLGQQRWVGRA